MRALYDSNHSAACWLLLIPCIRIKTVFLRTMFTTARNIPPGLLKGTMIFIAVVCSVFSFAQPDGSRSSLRHAQTTNLRISAPGFVEKRATASIFQAQDLAIALESRPSFSIPGVYSLIRLQQSVHTALLVYSKQAVKPRWSFFIFSMRTNSGDSDHLVWSQSRLDSAVQAFCFYFSSQLQAENLI